MEKIKEYILDKDGLQTPGWAKWAFRFALYILSTAVIGLNTLNMERIDLSPQDIKDLSGLFSFMILALHTLSKTIGIKIETEDPKP